MTAQHNRIAEKLKAGKINYIQFTIITILWIISQKLQEMKNEKLNKTTDIARVWLREIWRKQININ